jgi:NADH-quinone oxidoreductase subunit G
VREHTAASLGALASPHATLEELYLLQARACGSGGDNIDFRLRQSDFSGNGHAAGIPWLGMPVADLGSLDRVLVVGSFLRKDHPLARATPAPGRQEGHAGLHAAFGRRRLAAARRAPVDRRAVAHARGACRHRRRAAQASGAAIPAELADIVPGDAERAIAASLASGKKTAVLLGNLAVQHTDAAQLHALAQLLARTTGATLGFLTEAANTVGAYAAAAAAGNRAA